MIPDAYAQQRIILAVEMMRRSILGYGWIINPRHWQVKVIKLRDLLTGVTMLYVDGISICQFTIILCWVTWRLPNSTDAEANAILSAPLHAKCRSLHDWIANYSNNVVLNHLLDRLTFRTNFTLILTGQRILFYLEFVTSDISFHSQSFVSFVVLETCRSFPFHLISYNRCLNR